MAGIFIAGNGFDIAHGIPTKYSEFGYVGKEKWI